MINNLLKKENFYITIIILLSVLAKFLMKNISIFSSH